MEQEKRPNVTARERYVGKYNEATGQFDLVDLSTECCPHKSWSDYMKVHGEEEYALYDKAVASGSYIPPVLPEPEDPDHAVIRKHWESMGNL